jgi:hypothetical protein
VVVGLASPGAVGTRSRAGPALTGPCHSRSEHGQRRSEHVGTLLPVNYESVKRCPPCVLPPDSALLASRETFSFGTWTLALVYASLHLHSSRACRRPSTCIHASASIRQLISQSFPDPAEDHGATLPFGPRSEPRPPTRRPNSWRSVLRSWWPVRAVMGGRFSAHAIGTRSSTWIRAFCGTYPRRDAA